MSEPESKPCAKCGATDRTPAGTCRPCKAKSNANYLAKKAGGGSLKTATKGKVSRAEISAPATEVLEIEQGYGIKAWIDDPYLMIEQKDHDGRADTICLSRSELRLVIGKFTEWAGRC